MLPTRVYQIFSSIAKKILFSNLKQTIKLNMKISIKKYKLIYPKERFLKKKTFKTHKINFTSLMSIGGGSVTLFFTFKVFAVESVKIFLYKRLLTDKD